MIILQKHKIYLQIEIKLLVVDPHTETNRGRKFQLIKLIFKESNQFARRELLATMKLLLTHHSNPKHKNI